MRSLPKPNLRLERLRTRSRKRAAIRDAYRIVDLRDEGRCVVTQRFTVPGHPDPRVRREHHHVVPRSLAPERVDDPTNIITVCAEAHGALTCHHLVAEWTEAGWTFRWTVPPTDRPFRVAPSCRVTP